MKRTFLRLSLVALSLVALSLLAEVTTSGAKKLAIEGRLAQALKMFPDADTDKDGALSINEALAAIHQRSPVGLPVPASLKANPQAEALNLLLEQLAWEAVSSYPMSGVKSATTK